MTAKLKVQVGDKINKLTVTQIVSEPRKSSKSKRRFLLCTCECGGQIKREPSDIIRGLVQSCGCIRRTRDGLSNTLEYRMFKSAKRRAQSKGLPFNIEISDIIIPKRCPLLDIPLQDCKGNAGDSSPSLDRLIPHLGYVKGNILVISHRANQIKNCASLDELMMIADNLHNILINNN